MLNLSNLRNKKRSHRKLIHCEIVSFMGFDFVKPQINAQPIILK